MQEHIQIDDNKQINDDLLSGVLSWPKWWIAAASCLALVIATGLGAYGWELNKGVGVAGINRPVYWGFYLANFVFWIGISHAGIMVSAILRLTQAEWRRPVTRAAEVLTLFSLIAALSNIFFHLGRPWRAFWIGPYDFSRGIWPNIRSPFVWDPAAIGTYLIGSSLFVYVALIPDLAVVRDKAKGKVAKTVYGVLCLGWRGTPRQWKLQGVAGILLSALVLPVFVSVHSIVSWDFAVQIGVEGWHSTIFAPYFIIGAIHSGVSAVAMVMALMVWMWKGYDKYIRPDHFDAIGRLLIVVATTWFFFFALEFLYAIYTLEAPELALRELQVFEWPYGFLFIVFLLTSYFIPIPLWLFKNVRKSAKWMFWTTVLVNIGMWLERFLIIIPGLARRQAFTFDWGTYQPSIIEILLVAETFAFVALGILVFSKVFPLIPLFDVKEGMVFRDEIKIGRITVPASIRE
jgi:molybdopterin-containing oxidoreductase family membrane subunit